MDVVCALQVSNEHFDQEERKAMNQYHTMPAFVLHLIMSLCILFPFLHHILCSDSSLANKGSNHGKIFAAANHVPFLSIATTVLPS